MKNIPVTRFSIYPNKGVRILAHFIFWILMFLFFVFVESALFRVRPFELPILFFTLYCMPIIAINHYILTKVIVASVLKRKWWKSLLAIIFIYILSLSSIPFLGFLSEILPDNETIKLHYNARRITKITEVIAYSSVMWFFSIFVFNNLLGLFVFLTKQLYEQKQMQISLLKEKNKMELSFLRSQIQPHFLFNTLNNIYGLVIDNKKASQSILRLSDLLRFSLYDSSKDDITLKEEISFLTNYITLEKMRHKESKVQINYDFNDTQSSVQLIKPLLLVNFIENAFKHGVNTHIHDAWVKIDLKVQNNYLTFYVANNVAKRSDSKMETQKDDGIGFLNVRRRLELEYPDRFNLNIKETTEIYEVELTLQLG